MANVVKKAKRTNAKDAKDSTTTITCSETQQSEVPSTSRRKITGKKLEIERQRLEDEAINTKYQKLCGLGTAAPAINQLSTPDDMVSWAFRNRENTDNLLLLEWSEAVILQLCNLDERLTFRDMTWKTANSIYITNMWDIIIAIPLRTASGSTRNLDYYMKKNHRYKIVTFGMSDKCMFLTRPSINYDVLKKYEIKITSFNAPLSKRLCVQKK